jgi:hypothetical protein
VNAVLVVLDQHDLGGVPGAARLDLDPLADGEDPLEQADAVADGDGLVELAFLRVFRLQGAEPLDQVRFFAAIFAAASSPMRAAARRN